MNALDLLVVDDEAPALADLVRMLSADPRVGAVVEAADGASALALLPTRRFDAVFLDVRMPGLDGVEVGRVIRAFSAPPAVIFVTAYESAAVDAFSLRAVDYLLKPVSAARLAEAIDRIVDERRPVAAPAEPEADIVPVDNLRGGGTRLLPRSTILSLESHGDYVRVRAESGRYLMRMSLTEVERRWEPYGFVRVHRRYIVNLPRAQELRPLLNGAAELLLPDGIRVPVARRQVAVLRRRLGR